MHVCRASDHLIDVKQHLSADVRVRAPPAVCGVQLDQRQAVELFRGEALPGGGRGSQRRIGGELIRARTIQG